VFPWARLGVSALLKRAAAADLHLLEAWNHDRRAFVSVATCQAAEI
jgi:hypothetical protein